MVSTADFITPPVDDGYVFGQIAAANSLSDIYAMGAKPVMCLNLICFPPDKLDPQVLKQIVAGALERIGAAGAVLAGGHTVEDDEPKFGLAVTGVVHPRKIWRNAGARVDDALVLTKPLGSGVLFNANLKKWVSPSAMAACIETLTALNRKAAEIMAGYEIHAATDVTGFGLAGHGYEMASASGVCLEIGIDRLPVMAEALEMYERGMNTGVNAYNRELTAAATRFDTSVPDWHRQIVFDPQTSGGLLVSLPPEQADSLAAALQQAGVSAACRIGRVVPGEGSLRLVFV